MTTMAFQPRLCYRPLLGIALIALTTVSCGDQGRNSSSNRKNRYVEQKRVSGSPGMVAFLKPSLARTEGEEAPSKLITYELKIGQKELAAMERTALRHLAAALAELLADD